MRALGLRHPPAEGRQRGVAPQPDRRQFAHARGGARREYLDRGSGGRSLASHFADDLWMNQFVQRPGPRRGQTSSQLPGGAAEPAAGNARGALRRALRESTYTVEAARGAAEPADLALLPRAAAAVAKAARTGVGENLAALPMIKKDSWLTARERADSVLRDALRSWLGSGEAREWRASRRAFFGTDAADPGALPLGDAEASAAGAMGDGGSG